MNGIKILLKPALMVLGVFGLVGLACAAGGPSAPAGGISEVATNITTNLSGVAKLITAGSYVAGLGFAIGAILKFKAHKDNPTQIPVGTPIALIFIAAALLFLPSIMKSAGSTIFGSQAKTAGVDGITDYNDAQQF